jgi:hypothetical protein
MRRGPGQIMLPGDYEVPPAAAEQTSRATSFEDHVHYGRDRVANVPIQLSLMSDYHLHDDDRLIVQPTSFGAHWTV